MASYSWEGVSGDWNTASNWTPSGGPPKSTDSATINDSATDTITVDTADVANSLSFSDANATLNDDGSSASLTIGGALAMSNGTLDISPDGDGGVLTVSALALSGGALSVDDDGQLDINGTLSQTGGTMTLYSGGTISGGTTNVTGGTFVCDGGTLSGVTYDGALDLSASGASVHLADGTVVNDAAGTGPGTINDTGDGSTLYFDNTQTFNNATINLGNYSNLYEYDLTGAGTLLTLGSGVTIYESGIAQIETSDYAGDGIVNQGNITQSGTSSNLVIEGNSFTNSGTITAASSAGVLLIQSATFTNNGAMDISNGEEVFVDPTNFTNAATGVIAVGADSLLNLGSSWSNLGSITLASGSRLILGGSFSLVSLGNLTNSGGTVYIAGTFDNTGSTLNGSNVLGKPLLDGGTIDGGTVTPSGLNFANSRGSTLSGVTYNGTLDLSGASVHLANGTVVNTATGGTGGTINVGEDGTLYFDGTQTFNNATINLGTTSSGHSDLIEHSLAHGVLTLGSNVAIDESGHAHIKGGNEAGDGIVDQGNISQTASGGDLTILGTSFTNSGTITAASSGGALTIDPITFTDNSVIDISNGETVTIEPDYFSNAATGVIAVGADSTLNLTPRGSSWSNLGSITLATGSSLVLGGSFTLDGLGTLTNSGGTVYLKGTVDNTGGTLNGSSVIGQAVLDGGTIEGGTVTPAGLSFSDSGGTLSGVTYDGALDLSGSDADANVDVADGTVVNNAAGTGAGTINDTGDGSDLNFDDTQTFNNATINLGNASGYSYIDGATGAEAVLTLGSGITIDASGNGDITDGGGFGDAIVNQGNITQSGTSSKLVIEGNSFTNSGTITAASSGGTLYIFDNTFTNSGTLAVSNAEAVGIDTPVTGTGTETISGASTLEFDSAVSSSTTVGAQNIGFMAGGALDLNDPASFYGEISDFAAGDTVELLGSWAFSGFSENSAGTLATLTLVNGSTPHDFEFAGDYTQSNFNIASGTTTKVTYV